MHSPDPMTADLRLVYGARCSWWGWINEVATKPSGLPCCPHCGGVLFETDDGGRWFEQARQHEADGYPGYVAFLEWAHVQKRCWPGFDEAWSAYAVSVR